MLISFQSTHTDPHREGRAPQVPLFFRSIATIPEDSWSSSLPGRHLNPKYSRPRSLPRLNRFQMQFQRFMLSGCFSGAFLSAFLLATTLACPGATPKLIVTTNQNIITTSDGKPFFYLADTAWELIHRSTREDAKHYLRNRARKGFNVIHTAVLAELDGVRTGNAYNELPFADLDPTQPKEAFFAHVDYIIEEAMSLGLHIGLAPTWGDKVSRRWGRGPGKLFTEETAAAFGKYLGQRYKEKSVIWILGGDRNPDQEEHLAVWRAIANGINEANSGGQLITYLPMQGSSSSKWFHRDDWLSFNLAHTGQTLNPARALALTRQMFNQSPPKPCLDGEAPFEDHPIDWNPGSGWFTDWHVRSAAYRSVLSGAAGHTYGNHNVWQFWTPERHPVSFARTPWREALEQPGAEQMGHLKSFFSSRPWHKLDPRTAVTQDDGSSQSITAVSRDRTFLFSYTAEPVSLTINLENLSGKKLKAYWLNPRDGLASPLEEFDNSNKQKIFTPPSTAAREDWLLLVENAEKQEEQEKQP